MAFYIGRPYARAMNWRTLAGVLGVLAVALAVVGIVFNFFFDNELLLSSEMQAAALVSLGFVVLALAAFAAVGRPWRGWNRTPYW